MDQATQQQIEIPAFDQSGTAAADRQRQMFLPREMTRTSRCPERLPDEIVVCAPDQEQFRLRPPDRDFRQDVEPLELSIGEAVKVQPTVEAGSLGGIPTNRIMITGKIKFR